MTCILKLGALTKTWYAPRGIASKSPDHLFTSTRVGLVHTTTFSAVLVLEIGMAVGVVVS